MVWLRLRLMALSTIFQSCQAFSQKRRRKTRKEGRKRSKPQNSLTYHANCLQSLFFFEENIHAMSIVYSEKNKKKNIISLISAEFVHKMINGKQGEEAGTRENDGRTTSRTGLAFASDQNGEKQSQSLWCPNNLTKLTRFSCRFNFYNSLQI